MFFRLGSALFSLGSLLISLFAGSINLLTATDGTSVALQIGSSNRSVTSLSGSRNYMTGLADYEHSIGQIDPASRTNSTLYNKPLNMLQGSDGASIVFGGSDSYVDFGNPSKLHLTTFTVECWFRRDGTGKSITTGSGGMTCVIPLIARGRDESETANTDINYFLGIDTTQNVLAFDFEEGSGGAHPSLNHPLFGVTPITNGVWYHAAATYDGTTMRLYLNGTLDNTLAVGQPVDAASNTYASIGSALNSSDKASGFFNGAIDEVRIWNSSLSQAEIRTNLTQKISSAPNLVARWGLDEGSGTTVSDSASGAAPANGVVMGTSYSWAANAPVSMNFPPDPAAQPIPANNASGVSTSPTLNVQASDPEKDVLTVNFYGRQKTLSFGPMFTYVVLPDTQTYVTSQSGATIFNSQTQWIVDNRSIWNVSFVSHLGDITENGNNDTDESEWIIANNAMSKLELGTPDPSDDIPFGVIPGNHDVLNGLTLYEKYFGVARFTGRPYYGGHYGSDNANNYSLFSASGLDFIVLDLNCGSSTPSSAVLSWAGGLLRNNPSRRGIVTCHYVVGSGNPGSFSSAGKAIYNALKVYPNLFLMLGGHIGNEAQRQDLYNGSTVYSLLQDYQNIGKGWLRLFEFTPSASVIHVQTYSPYLNQYQTDANSDFNLHYDMGLSYTRIGSVSVPAGMGMASITWPGLGSNTAYEWYAVITDAQGSTLGPTYSFTTAGQNQPPIANNDSYSTAENTSLVISAPGLLLNDTHSSGSTLTAVWVSNPINGTLILNPNGAFTYQPKADWYGTDSYTYKANDGLSNSNIATVTIKVNQVNKPPVCSDVTLKTDENVPGQASPNCTDAEGSPLSFSLASQPGHGTASIEANKLVYSPAAYYNGADSFTYKANDGQADSNVATVRVTINLVNYAPVADAKSVQTDQNKSLPITLTGSDVDGDPLTFFIVNQPANGALSGTLPELIYTPNQDWNGTDSFTYKANDGQLDSNIASVTILVNPGPINVALVCSDVTLKTDENVPGQASPNCTDAEGSPLSFSLASQPGHGTASIEAGKLVYSPAAYYNGADSFTYKANDGQADSNVATVRVTINPVNYAPVADAKSIQTDQNKSLPITLTGSDVDGDPLTFFIVNQPANGALSGTLPELTYTPNQDWIGTDSFTYKANDGQTDSAPATVTVTVGSVNHNPVAVDDSATTPQDTPVTIDVLANDTDADQDTLSIESTTTPSNGLVVVNPDNSITYTPNTGFLGSDSFTYGIVDGHGGSASAIVSITVVAKFQIYFPLLGQVTTGQYSDSVLLRAKLVDGSGNPVVGATISFSIGSQSSTGTTGLDGSASTNLQLNQPAGSYTAQAVLVGNEHDQVISASQPFIINPEDAYIEYTGEQIVLYGSSNNLVATVWDSAANGYPGINPETVAPTIGDISKIWVAFDIYSITNCGKNPPATTKYAHVIDTGIPGDGIGVATATTTRSENVYCVMVRLVSDSSGGTNPWYKADRSQPAGLVAYKVLSPEAVGSGWFDDPSGGKGNFAFSAKLSNNVPSGKLFYGYRGLYKGETADFIVQSSSITSLAVSGTTYPRAGNFAGKGTFQILRVSDGALLYSSSSMTFTAVVTDSGANPGDTFSLVILVSKTPYKSIPAIPVKGGEIFVN